MRASCSKRACIYFIEKDDAERYAIEIGYADLDEAYDDGAYCYTEWDWEDEGEWYEKHDGVWYECTNDSKVELNMNSNLFWKQ